MCTTKTSIEIQLDYLAELNKFCTNTDPKIVTVQCQNKFYYFGLLHINILKTFWKILSFVIVVIVQSNIWLHLILNYYNFLSKRFN
jgi:hypothetical protein